MKKLFFLSYFIIVCLACVAQNVGIGTATPLNKLHVAGGFRLDTLANGIDSGVLVHNKNGVIFNLKFTGLSTDVLLGNGKFGAPPSGPVGWFLTGNAGINPATQFLGTTDAHPLYLRVNNLPAGQIHHTTGNTAIGLNTLGSISTGIANSVFGSDAGATNTSGSQNSFFGNKAGYSNT